MCLKKRKNECGKNNQQGAENRRYERHHQFDRNELLTAHAVDDILSVGAEKYIHFVTSMIRVRQAG